MTLGIHLSGKVLVVLIDDVLCLGIVYHCHCLDGESKQLLQAKLVEPLHEHTLQCINSLPFRLRTVRITEVGKETLEVCMVVV